MPGILKAHPLKAQVPTGAPGLRHAGVGLGPHVQQLKQALRAGQPALNHVVDVGQPADRLKNHGHRRHKCHEFAGRQLVLRREAGRHPDHRRHRHRGQHLHQRHIERRNPHGAHGLAAQFFGDAAKAPGFVGVGTEELDLAHAVQALFNRSCHQTGTLLHGLVTTAQLAAGHLDQPRCQRRNGNNQQRELPGCPEQVAGEADDDHAVTDDHNPGRRERRPHLRYVVQNARHHASRRLLQVGAQGQMHLVREHLLAQIGDRLVGDPQAGHIGHVLRHTLEREGNHHQHRHLPLRIDVLANQVLINQRLEQGRQHRLQRRGGHHRQDREAHHAPVGTDAGEKAPVKKE